jgi:hypothetical protein
VSEEPVHGLRDARVVLLDRRRPWRPDAEGWLVRQAAVVSRPQAAQCETNGPIPVVGERTVRRPPRYRRAGIVRTDEGELDVKGIGVAPGCRPVRGHYSDGLLPLVDALREYLIERLVDEVLVRSGLGVRTLPHHAVLDAGFDGVGEDGAAFRAGLLVRPATVRSPDADVPRWDTAAHHRSVALELLFRRHGLTSTKRNPFEIREEDGELVTCFRQEPVEDPDGAAAQIVEHLDLSLPFVADRVNVQTDDAGGQVVDFGQYGAERCFDRPLVSVVCDLPLGWGGALFPTDDAYVQPDPALVPAGPWWEDACAPRALLFAPLAEELVDAWLAGDLDAGAVGDRADEVIATMTAGWPAAC